VVLRIVVSPGVDNYTLKVSGTLNGAIRSGDDNAAVGKLEFSF
jgi:hypothetical protein